MDWLKNPETYAVSLVIAIIVEVAKHLIKAKSPKAAGVVPAMPVAIGALLGLVPIFPLPAEIDPSHRLPWYLLCGIIAQSGYDTLVVSARKVTESLRKSK